MPDSNVTLIPPVLYFWRDVDWGTLHWTPKCPAAFYERPALYGWKVDPVHGQLFWDGQTMGLRSVRIGLGLQASPLGLKTIADKKGRKICVTCYHRARNEAGRKVVEMLQQRQEETNAPGAEAPGDDAAE